MEKIKNIWLASVHVEHDSLNSLVLFIIFTNFDRISGK